MERERSAMREHDLIIGKSLDGRDFLCFGGGEHGILHARSGAGKSVGFSIPNAFAWPGSLVCLDIKRELFRHTAGPRASRGHDVILFDPAAPDGRSHRWNPFWQVDRESPERFDQISRISFQIWPEALQPGTGNTDFWNSAAREAFCAVANLLAETTSEPLTMAAILRLFVRYDSDVWMLAKIAQARNTPQPYTREVVDGIARLVHEERKLRAEIARTVTTKLQIWTNPRVAAATSATDFDLRDIQRKKMAIYVGVSPGDIPRNAPLLRLFFDALLNVNTSTTPEQDRTLRIPALILLDEFAQLGRMDRLAHALQYVRGYGLRIALVVQNRAQIMDVYGSYAASDVFDNVGCEMVYGTGDEKLAEQLEKRLGDATVGVVTQNRPRWFAWAQPARQHEAEHPHRRPLMLRQEILQMPSDEQIILRPGMKPIRAKKVRWYQEPAFLERRRDPPKIPQLAVEILLDDGSVDLARRRGGPGAPAIEARPTDE
jgi:type IV secretion system protein VirD4